jgi:predicted Zn-dependent protease with MMP-like domain
MKSHRKLLTSIAQDEVQRTLAALPVRLRQAAAAVPVTFASRPSQDMKEDGIDADTLGLFLGEAFPDEENALSPVPPRVLLFLDNLWELAEGNPELFRREIRTTLLHELGHYLGLDEADLESRGLE